MVLTTLVTRHFREWYQSKFTEIITPEKHRKSFKKPTNQLVAEWVMKAIGKISEQNIVASFVKTEICCKIAQKRILDEQVTKYFLNRPRVKEKKEPPTTDVKQEPFEVNEKKEKIDNKDAKNEENKLKDETLTDPNSPKKILEELKKSAW